MFRKSSFAIGAAAVLAASPLASANPSLEVVLRVPTDWLEIATAPSSFIAEPDAENMKRGPGGRLYLFNGSDTDDGDGDGVFNFPAGAAVNSGFILMIQGSSDSAANPTDSTTLEGAMQLAGHTPNGGGETVRGMGVDSSGNVLFGFDNGSTSFLVRVPSTSNVAGTPMAEIIAGAVATAGNPMDGVNALDCESTGAYVLLRSAFGASEDKVVVFDSTGGTGQSGTVIVSEADLVTAGHNPAADQMSGLYVTPTHIYLSSRGASNQNGKFYRFPIGGGAGTLLKTMNAVETDTGRALNSISASDRGFCVNPANGDIFFSTFKGAAWDILRIDGATGTAYDFALDADIVANANYVSQINGGALENQVEALDIVGGFLYVSLESANSNTDSVIRFELPSAAVANYTLY